MKLNFNFQLKNIAGLDFEGENNNAGEILSVILSLHQKGNAVKLWDWAQKIYKKQELELDNTDAEVLLSLIETEEKLPAMTKAQLISVIKKELLK